ncbi:MAG TPA: DUF3293 domain-containing protein [Rhodanobacteraceae bacterium]|nr:DUF3293 domain-containing protein [Rhodanobacteraceae bacterium]
MDSYLRSDYRVRLAQGGCASIRVGQPLPAALRATLPDAGAPWGFITAWNPWSTPRPPAVNRTAQRQLLAALRAQVPASCVRAAVGVDADGKRWREPSLFAAGVAFAVLDALMLRFGQHAIVRGTGAGPAELHWAP